MTADKELTRYAISTSEEIWVKACNEFFEKNGYWSWFKVPKEEAFTQIMFYTRGRGNPLAIKERIYKMYEDAGVKYL